MVGMDPGPTILHADLDARAAELDEREQLLGESSTEMASEREAIEAARSTLAAQQAEIERRRAEIEAKEAEVSDRIGSVDEMQAKLDSGKLLMDFIAALEKALGRKAELEMLPMQPGDVPDTFADVSELQTAVGYSPSTPVEEGVAKFVDWYLHYHDVAQASA